MRYLLATAALLTLGACASVPAVDLAPETADTVIRNVTVIDPQSGTSQSGRDVYIDDGRIVELAETGVSTRAAEEVVDGEGHFLIPGLMNTHTHSNFGPVRDTSLKLMLANGVTGVREMGSDCVRPGGFAICIDEMRATQAEIEAGTIVGPRLLELSSSKIDSNRPDEAGELQIAYRPLTAEDARATVAFMQDRGADILKTGDEFMPEAFTAFADEAQQRGMRFGGHIPPYLSTADVAAMGMTSIEHARDLPLDCSRFGSEYRAGVLAALTGESDSWPDRMLMHGNARDTFDEDICAAQIAAMVEHGTYYVPTHLTREMDYRAGEDAYRDDPRFAYIPELQRLDWFRDMDRTVDRLAPIQGDLEDFFHLGLRTTGMAHAGGVRVMAGTDSNDTMVFPGFSLHDELRHLVAAGLTPMEALQAATSVPAEYFGRSDDLGGVAEGRIADLVLLSADPLVDIDNTTQIEAVIFGGRVRDRAALDALLEEVLAQVADTNERLRAMRGE